MPLFQPQPFPYDWRGFKHQIAVTLVCLVIGGWLTWLMAPESIVCERDSAGAVRCFLTREVYGFPIHERTIQGVQSVTLVNNEASTRRSNSDADPAYYPRLFAANSILDAQETNDEPEAAEAVNRLQVFLQDKSAKEFEAHISGTPMPMKIGLVIFVVGASVLPCWLLGYFIPALRLHTQAPRPQR